MAVAFEEKTWYNEKKRRKGVLAMKLYFIRHGQPIYDPDSLTPLGHAQAEALSKWFLHRAPDKIYASSSNRAVQTSMPTCKLLGKDTK